MTRRLARPVVLLVALGLGSGLTPAARAYLKLGARVGTQVVGLRWSRFPVPYFVTNRDAPGVSAADLQTAIDHAFATWGAVPGTGISGQFGGFTSNEPFADDGANVMGFRARPELERTLAATTFVVDETDGSLVESDIFFNLTPAFTWSASANGEAGRYDLQSVALHEVGHLLGLSHSALGETELRPDGGRRVLGKRAVMFPIAYAPGSLVDRTLKPDDVAGIQDVYRTPAFRQDLGAVSGRVTLAGRGVFGAHVTALSMATGTLVGGFSLDEQGSFVLGGLTPGLYVIRAEPLDDADIDSFFDEDTFVDLDFRPAYFERLVSVPAGGAASPIEIAVKSK